MEQWNTGGVPRNREGNIPGTGSLGALAIKVLERNKERNNLGTKGQNPVPQGSPNSLACGTEVDANRATEAHDLLYAFNERAAILEYEGGFTRGEAEKLARISIEANHKEWLYRPQVA